MNRSVNIYVDDNGGNNYGSESTSIEANCQQMCPHDEMVFREKNGLLHRLELLDVQLWPQYRTRYRFKKSSKKISDNNNNNSSTIKTNNFQSFTDHTKAIKQYQRPSAGQSLQKSSQIRSTVVLRRTVDYLLGDIIGLMENISDDPVTLFGHYYDFTFDRLRSVRQDLIIQRATDEHCFYILEKCIEFYIYSEYIWQTFQSTKSDSELKSLAASFDSHLNHVHLTECLSLLIKFYDFLEDNLWSISRHIYEAIYMIYNLESNNLCYQRYQQLKLSPLSKNLFDNRIVQFADRILHSYVWGNYIKCLRLINQQISNSKLWNPLISVAFFISSLSHIHLRLLKQLCVAFRSPNSKIPLPTISDWFCPSMFDSDRCSIYLEKICHSQNIPVHSSAVNSVDYFNFDNNNQNNGDNRPQDNHQNKIIILNKKFENLNEWRLPGNFHPDGWFPKLTNSYRVFLKS